MFVCQPENNNQQSALGRDPEQIKALMKMHQGTTETSKQKYPDVSYEEACQMYKYYKSRTHKVDQDDPDFEQNLEFREFFLGIKKRYDMQERARRFRHKQKAEIAILRDFAEKKSDTGVVSLLGKRSRCQVDPKFQEMEVRIKNLENLVQQKNQQIQELEQEKSLKRQKTIEVSQADQSTLVTKQKSGGSTLENTIEEVFEGEKPEIVVSNCENDEQKSTGPYSVNQKKRQLIIKIDTSNEPSFLYEESCIDKEQSIEPFDTSKSCIEEAAPSCQNEQQSVAAASISERAQNFMQSNRIQQLLQKVVDQKLEYTNILKYKVINEKEAEIRSDRQLLSNQMNEFLQQKLTYARLRQQPEQLLAKRNSLLKSLEGLEQEVIYTEQNYNNTLCHIDELEQVLQESEEQIQMMNEKINENISELENLKENQYQIC